MNLKTGFYERLGNTVLDGALCTLPGDTKMLQAILDRPDRNFLLYYLLTHRTISPKIRALKRGQ